MQDSQSQNGKADDKKKSTLSFNWLLAATLLILAVEVFGTAGLAAFFQFSRKVREYEPAPVKETLWLKELRIAEQEALNSYRLLDSENGVYRIPVRRAMEQMARELKTP